ncbi:MAG: fimbrillin family protein, partial [Muribaculaceae bacterium]|nr:fimbrillin family protein [Muribaculaceae bacterium]
MKQRHIYIVMAAMLALTACSDDYFNKDVEHEFSEYIGYSVSVKGSDEFQSRAGVVNGRHITIEPVGESLGGRPLYLHTEVLDSIPQSVTRAKNGTESLSRGTVTYTSGLKDINISAVVFDGEKDSWPSGSATAQMYMHNETVSAPSWNTNRYWPKENDWIRFYAYAPCDALSLGEISAAEPSFDYTVAGDIPDQVDLLVGSEQYTGWKCETAQLDMGHALTAVKIHIDGNVSDFTLTSLKISGLKDSGTYTYDYNESTVGDGVETTSTHDAGTWSNLAGEAAYTVYKDEAGMSLTKIENDGNGNSLIDPETGKSVGYTDMTAGNMVLFMMPQVLSDNAKITITGKDKVLNEEVELSAVIGGGTKEWVKGNLYTYTLSFSSTKIEYHLEVKPEKTQIPFYGAKAAYTVKSYKTVTRSGLASFNVEVPWKVYEITDDGTEKSVPDWFIMEAVEGSGNVSVLSYNYSVIPNLDAASSQSHQNLSGNGNAHKGSVDDPYNLSNNQLYSVNKTPVNTANCYIVSAPGYYTFPLIYGNAVTNGMVMNNSFTGIDVVKSEEQAYVTKAEGEEIKDSLATATVKTLMAFKDHADNDITQPWISSSRGGKYTPASAEIVWQDEPCLVTEVELNDLNDYITFRVREDCICEGNAIIAVKDANGDIMWSWHIWVSDGLNYYDNGSGSFDYYPSETDPNTFVTRPHESRRPNSKWVDYNYTAATETPAPGSYTESLFYMMPAHIGHCDGESKNYPGRSLTLRFKQYEADDVEYAGTLDAPKEFVFTQAEGNVSTVDNIPYYQYGRKDPMLPTMTGSKTDKYHYFNDWTQGTKIKVGAGQASISDAIKNPGTYYHNTGSRSYNSTTYVQYNNWCSDGPYINLWNSSANILPMFSYHLTVKTAEFHEKFNSIIACGVTKTIYDPCPPGFELPRIDAFAGATYSGINMWPFHYNYDPDVVKQTNKDDYKTSDNGTYALHKQAN